MSLEKNDLGGVNDMSNVALVHAKRVDLVTLPESVRGTNCYNCKWISAQKEKDSAFCRNVSVKQYVNNRMCCALWDAKGTYRPFDKEDKYK